MLNVAANGSHPSNNANTRKSFDENSQPKQPTDNSSSSPLSLVSTELKLADSSRNRKPIYIGQANNCETE